MPEPAPEHPPLEVVYGTAEPGDLAAEVAAFPGLEACAAALRREVPAPIAEVLADVGYTAIAEDGCRTILAIRERSIGACDALAVRDARLGCRRRYAMFHGEPDHCPEERARAGRDPVCVAVAMRDQSMCRAEADPDRQAVCRAVVLRSERPCRVAHRTEPAVAACARAARRLWGAMPERAGLPLVPNEFEPAFEIRILRAGSEPADASGPPEAGAARSRLLDRGIVLPLEGVVVGGRYQPPVGDRAPLVELRLPEPAGEPPWTFEVGPSRATAWVRLGDDQPVGSADGVTGEVTLERFARSRGALVEGRARLALPGGRGLEARFRTFVRDTEGPAPPGATE